MKNNSFIKVACIAMLFPAVFSCEEADLSLPTRKENFSDKQWEIDAWDLETPLDIDDDGRAETDLMDLLETCDEDNLITFAKNGKVLEDAGLDLCEDDQPGEIHTYNWDFDKKDQAIIIRDPLTNKKTDEWEVVFQTDNRLWIKFNLLPDHSKNSLVKTIVKLNKR
ncbi:hypothetical protein [Dyadobacter alkalitolerans]|uniref:hypothetical protein n=1 Tax=Dyadobacter alkalitolerans TaxID=492736 RepID=UPI00047B29D0|nr:hypothetical protein [Dyadobacter alkalitolerans]